MPASLSYVNRELLDAYGDVFENIISGHSKDIYFNAPKDARADFVRVRFGTDDEESQLTLKFSDRKHNKNRIEFDLDITDPKKAVSMLSYCFGKPAGEIKKRYHVYFFNKYDNISVYQIDGDKRVFIEIEATTPKKLARLYRNLRAHCPGLQMTTVDQSLFQLFLT